MSDWVTVLYLCGMGLAGWLMYRQIKQHPELFSSENLIKSSNVLAVLALALIAFIGLVVIVLRNG
ncbi:MAG: hypothetical protein CMF51_00375 [Legionellales bacterium]|nr:hypothetical protein [Legionellales bacterium]